MKDNERTDFAKLLTGMAELYGKKMSPMLMNIYWVALRRLNLVDIRQSFNRHVNDVAIGQFMPKPADIIRQLEGSSEHHALTAWSIVESAIRRIGGYESVIFQDPVIYCVIKQMGGWPRLCGMLTHDLPFKAAEFMRLYQQYFNDKSKQSGINSTDQTNSVLLGKLPTGSPVLVGARSVGVTNSQKTLEGNVDEEPS